MFPCAFSVHTKSTSPTHISDIDREAMDFLVISHSDTIDSQGRYELSCRDYWLEFGKLQCVTLDWERKLLPLAKLDLDETVRLNREHNLEFVIRSRDSSEP
jgi:hypothetical protein